MSGNTFKAAIRNIRKGKIFSLINILGLAMGLSACLLIALFVADEFNYDRYNEKADRIFRIVYDAHLNGNSFVGNFAPYPMGAALVAEYPRIEKTVRIRPVLISALRDCYRSLDRSAGQPFVYSFMDDDFNKIYESDQRTGRIFISFSLFAIFIACLGLFGLVSYAAEVRTKEIGIRKVLGASVSQIVVLLSADLLKLLILSSVIACPVAWWIMNSWLQDFAFRTTIGWWIFLLSIVLAALIALLTICFRAIKAAIANPVHSLKME